MAPYKKPLRRWANVIGGGLLMVQIVMMLAVYLLWMPFSLHFFDGLSDAGWDLVDQSINLVGYVLAFFIPTMFMVAMIKIPAPIAFPMRRPRLSLLIPAFFIALGAAMLGSTLNGILTVLLEAAFGITPIMPDFSAPQGLAANIVYVASMTVAPAIFEEMMFRGVIMQSLRRFGDGFALAISAVLFGMIHGNLVQGSNAILMGLVIGYFVLRTGSLVTGMVIHFLYNGLIVLFNYMLDFMTTRQGELLNMGVLVTYLLLGAAALVFLLFRDAGAFQLAPSNYPLPGKQKVKTFAGAAAIVIFTIFTVVLTCFYFE